MSTPSPSERATLALQNIMWGVTQPFAGAIADRYGAEILRESPHDPLPAARRRKLTLHFARMHVPFMLLMMIRLQLMQP